LSRKPSDYNNIGTSEALESVSIGVRSNSKHSQWDCMGSYIFCLIVLLGQRDFTIVISYADFTITTITKVTIADDLDYKIILHSAKYFMGGQKYRSTRACLFSLVTTNSSDN
jgi:hypothetical protein